MYSVCIHNLVALSQPPQKNEISDFFIDCFFVLLQMMKHVQLSPYRSRADTVSLSSTTSYGSLSPEPLGSRSSSYSSLNEGSIQVNYDLKFLVAMHQVH